MDCKNIPNKNFLKFKINFRITISILLIVFACTFGSIECNRNIGNDFEQY